MEGDIGAAATSQRVAAILQGLEEAGVVLTMRSRHREQQNRRNASKPSLAAVKPIILERCSVQTNTDCTGASHANNSTRGIQISDDRYTSCYQVAHCSVRPSSPPVTVSEFPPQRLRPSHFDGNFEVGGSGSCSRKITGSKSLRYRGLVSPDRRSINRIPSYEAEPFALTLRKYPSFPVLKTVSSEMVAQLERTFRKHRVLSPNRTPSGDLMEQVLRQTQAKLCPAQTTKSTRSFRKDRSKWRQPKYMQAYVNTTDSPDDRRIDRPTSSRKGDVKPQRNWTGSDDDQRFGKRRRKFGSRTESLLDTTYDYLKPSQPSYSPTSRRSDKDPRTEDIAKHVRMALGEIYNQRSVLFPMCSKVQRRYDEHKKRCTGRSADARVPSHQHRIASGSGLCRFFEFLNGYVSPDSCNISKLSDSSKDRLLNHRTKGSQYLQPEAGCRCGPDPTQVDSICPCRPYDGYTRYSIREEVNAWSSEIPVRINERTEDKALRESVIKDLCTTIENLLYDDDFEDNVKNAVKECLDAMPMWNAGSELKKDQFKYHLVQNLLDRIIPKPANKLYDAVAVFVDSIDFHYEVDTKRISDDIILALQSITLPKSNSLEEYNLCVSEIYKVLERLPIKVNGDKHEGLNKLTKRLASNVIELLKDNIAERGMKEKYCTSNAKNKLRQCSLMGPCKRAEFRPFYNRQKPSQYVCDSDTCDYNSYSNNKSLICDCCSKSNAKTDCICQAETNRIRHPCNCETGDEYYSKCIDEEVDNWLNEIPVPINENELDIKKRKHTSKHLADALKKLPDDKKFSENAKEVIKKWVDNISMWDPGTENDNIKLKRLLTDQLFDRITAINRRPDKLTMIIKKFIDLLHLEDNDIDKKELTKNLSKRLKYVAVAFEDSEIFKDLLTSEILETLKESLPRVSDLNLGYLHTVAKKLAQEIINNFSDIDVCAGETTDTKENIMKNLSGWIEEISAVSETPPNTRDVKKVIDQLATKLVDLQSAGSDKTAIKKMKNEIQSSLKKLNISTKDMDNLMENIIDSITDTLYAKDKAELEENHKREIFKGLNNWLKDKEEMDNLTPKEQYSLVREIVGKIVNAKTEGREDHQDVLIESLAKAGIFVDPDVQLEGLINTWNTLSETQKENDLKDRMQSNFNDTIDTFNIPEENKIYLKDNLRKALDKNITSRLTNTKKGAESMNETLLETIDEIVEDLQLPKTLKGQLDDIVNKNIEQLISAKDKDSVIISLLKEMNYIIAKEEIPTIIKKDLKNKLKPMLEKYSAMPFSNYVKDQMFENIDRIISAAPLESAIKEGLTNKLIFVAHDKLHALPTQTVKDHLKEKMLKDIDLTIEKAPLKENVKTDLYQMLKYILNENLKQPFSGYVRDDTLDQFHETINELLIPDITKGDLLKTITNIVSKNLDKLPHQTEMDYTKEVISNDINDLIDNLALSIEESTDLKEGLKCKLAEYLDRPYSNDLREKLVEALDKTIAKMPITVEKKEELTSNLTDAIDRRLDNLTYQSTEDYAKELILRDLYNMLDETSMSKREKDNLKDKFEDLIENCFSTDDLDIVKNLISEGIRHTIHQSSLPQSEQNELVDKMIDIAGKILDETFYDDRMRDYLRNMYGIIETELKAMPSQTHKDVLKNEVKLALDKYLQDPELLNIVEDSSTYKLLNQQEGSESNINDYIIGDITNIIEEIPIPMNKKNILKNKLNNLAYDTNHPKTVKEVLKGLHKTVDELSIPWQEKKILKLKLADLEPKNVGIEELKNSFLKHIDSAIDLDSLSEPQKKELKNKFSDWVSSFDEPMSNNTENLIKHGLCKIIDDTTFSKDQKYNLKNKIGNIVPKLPIKEKIVGYATEVIDEAPIRHHLKKDLRLQLKNAISENFKHPLTRETQLKLKDDFNNIIDEIPITQYQREGLKRKLSNILNRELEQLPIDKNDAKDVLVSDIAKILEDKSISNASKSKLEQELQKAFFKNIDEPLSVDMKNKIRQNIAKTIDEAILSNEKKTELKEELDHAASKYFALSSSSKPASNLSSALVRNICNVIKDAPISHENKRHLKKKIEENLPQKLKEPMYQDLEDTVNTEMLKIISEVSLPQAQKKILEKFLSNTVSQIVQEHQSKALKDDLKDNLLRDANYVIEKLNMPKESKKQLKYKLKEFIDDNLEKLLTGDNPKVVKKHIADIVAQAPLTPEKKAEIRRDLTNIVDEYLPHLTSDTHSKPNIIKPIKNSKRTVLNGIDAVLDSLPITAEDNVYIKQMLELEVNKISEQPPEAIKETINIILDDTTIPKNKKAEVRDKLYNTLISNLNTPGNLNDKQLSSINDSVSNGLNEILDVLNVPSEQKHYLKNKLEDVMAECSNRTASYDKLQEIKDNICNIISEMPISKNKRSQLSNKILDLVQSSFVEASTRQSNTSNQRKTPPNIYLPSTKKKCVLQEVDATVDMIAIPIEHEQNLRSDLKKIVQESLESPLTTYTGDTIKRKISKMVNDSPILEKNKKNEIKNKLLNMVDNKIKPIIASSEDSKKIMPQEIEIALDSLPIPSDKKDKINKILNSMIHDRQPAEFRKETINKIIDDTPIPRNKKTEIKRKLDDFIDSINETKNEEIVRNINSTIDNLDTSENLKSILKNVVHKNTENEISSNTLSPEILKKALAKEIKLAPIPREEKTQIESMLNEVIDGNSELMDVAPITVKLFSIKDTVLDKIKNDIDSAQIPIDTKANLKDEIKKKMIRFLDTPQPINNFENIKEDIINIIKEAPIPENKKSQLIQNILDNLNRNIEHLLEDTPSYYNPRDTTAMRYEDRDKSASRISRPSSHNADESNVRKKKLKETILRDFGETIDIFNIPRNKKADLKIKLNGITNSNIDKLFSYPNKDAIETKRVIADKIGQVIDETSMGPTFTRQMKNDLKDQLLKVANKNLDAMSDSAKTNGPSNMLLNAIDKLPMPSHIKDELRNKMLKSPEGSENSSQESRRLSPTRRHSSAISVIPEEGPVTSTPRRGRKSWERPVGSFSTIANEDFLESLGPEVIEYWRQVAENISTWLDELPVHLDEDTKAAIKQEIANDITDRLQYLDLNPGARKTKKEELEDLKYQVYRRLGKVLNREEMEAVIQEGNKLMQMMMEVEDPIGDATALENSAELDIHQQIKDIISDTLPDLENASSELLHSFEIMKDELADAFIKLHYTGGDEEETNKLRKKINDEIDKFCNDYLKRYPDKPIDREKLKRDLYNALKKVQPTDDAMKSVVEHVRLKDVVNDWVNKLPLKKLTTAERIKLNKDVAKLAKTLLYLEQNENNLSDGEITKRMDREITNFLNMLPLKPGQEKNIAKFKNELIAKLKQTKADRTVLDSTRHSVTLDDFVGTSSTRWPSYPPCTLSAEDLEHLVRIRKRACMAPDCLATLLKKSESKRNASINPMSVESGAQTDLARTDHSPEEVRIPSGIPPCSSSFDPVPKVCPGQPLPPDQFCRMKFTDSVCTQSLSHMDVQPQIIIREYFWNSTDTPQMQKSESRLSRRTCFAQRPTPRCQQKFSQTCQDRVQSPPPCAPSRCTPPPCSPRFYTPKPCPTNIPPPCYSPCQRVNPQNSCSENTAPRRDCQFPCSEPPLIRSRRRERVIELGSLDELRNPSQRERRVEDFGFSIRNPGQTVCEEPHPCDDDIEEVEVQANRVHKKPSAVQCKCAPGTNSRGRWKHDARKERGALAGSDKSDMKRCLKCCGLHCPYPSFMYFRH